MTGDPMHKVRYVALRSCSWRSFSAERGQALLPEDLVTADGEPLPADVIATMEGRSRALVRSEWWVNPALLAACRATPDDDLPRLVYADWLEERGQLDWANVIRTMLVRRGKGYAVEDGRTRPAKRIGDLLDRVFPAIRPTAAVEVGTHPRCEFDRGFIQTVYCSWAWWQASAEQVLDAAVSPTVVLLDRSVLGGLAERWPAVKEWLTPLALLGEQEMLQTPGWRAVDLAMRARGVSSQPQPRSDDERAE